MDNALQSSNLLNEINVRRVMTSIFNDQQPGTSGLRKSVKVFQQKHYLENFIQSTFNALETTEKKKLVLGGDGRFFNDVAIQMAIKMAVANGYESIVVCRNGIGSTPVISHLIRQELASGGIILSASHNPAGPDKDFGIKYNNASGSPAPISITDVIYQESLSLKHYLVADIPDVSLDTLQELTYHIKEATDETEYRKVTISVIDPVQAYTDLMSESFDFSLLKEAFSKKRLSLRFDAMHAVTGPFAIDLFEKTLGATSGSVINAIPLTDFGGGHPDPNLVNAKPLCDYMSNESLDARAMAAASDGDGDRNLILGKGCFVSPSDSLSVILEYAKIIPQFSAGLVGVARSMPTSQAVDRVAAKLNIPCYETPTGWKYFGNLLDAGRINICGEESFGSGGDHIREKDGLWAVLCWLSIIAYTDKSVAQILVEHWQKYGRSLYVRYDYEGIDSKAANHLMETLRTRCKKLSDSDKNDYSIERAEDFSYCDPVDQSQVDQQGICIHLKSQARVIYRLSGTGTQGATLRVYLEQYDPDCHNVKRDVFQAVESLAQMAIEFADIENLAGMSEPTVKT